MPTRKSQALMLTAVTVASFLPWMSSVAEAQSPLISECENAIRQHIVKAPARSSAVLVTNDASTQVVTFLTGWLDPTSGGETIDGGLTELISNRTEGGAPDMQPFSIRQPEKAHMSVTNRGFIVIKWPGGGTTTEKASCSPNGTFVFSHGSYTGVLTLKSQVVR